MGLDAFHVTPIVCFKFPDLTTLNMKSPMCSRWRENFLSKSILTEYLIWTDDSAQDRCASPLEFKSGASYGKKVVIKANCTTSTQFWVSPATAALHNKIEDANCRGNCVFQWSFQLLKKHTGSIQFMYKQKGI